MNTGTRDGRRSDGDRDLALADAFRDILEDAPAVFAMTRGRGHILQSANAAFRKLAGDGSNEEEGRPITDVLHVAGLRSLLDLALTEGLTLHNDVSISTTDGAAAWECNVWPLPLDEHQPAGLVVELRSRVDADAALALQRDLAERMLLGALREKESAEAAEASHERASFLAKAGRRLSESIDEETTWEAITAMHLPGSAAWCIVDIIEGGVPRRLAIIHPDPEKQVAVRILESTWKPQPGDPFGVPAVPGADDVAIIVDDIDGALSRSSHDPEQLDVLRDLGVGTLLTVPMVSHGRVMGAITFVGSEAGRTYPPVEITLARELALRSAMALDSARLYGEAVTLRAKAEAANRTKSEFLGHMSHELRTPLNAIGGYVDIIDMEIHGPVTTRQRTDLDRIRASQQHLLRLINDILGFIQLQSGKSTYRMLEVSVNDILASSVILLEPMLFQKQLTHRVDECAPGLKVHGDPDRTQQILINLLSNAVKFTEPGGQIAIECRVNGEAVLISVNDTGIGIAADRLDSVFEPFVQVKSGLTEREGGVGLGLAISRDLARGMGGDLTARSTPGQGSQFTLSLKRVSGKGAT